MFNILQKYRCWLRVWLHCKLLEGGHSIAYYHNALGQQTYYCKACRYNLD